MSDSFDTWNGWWLGALAVFITIIVVVVGWRVGWWFQQSVANHETHIIRSGYNNQSTLRQTMLAKIGDVATLDAAAASDPANADTYRAQRKPIVALVCTLDQDLTGDRPPLIVSFVRKECP